MANIEAGVTGRRSPTRRRRRRQPRRETADQIGVCRRTIERWEKDPRLNFPKPLIVNGRKYDDPEEVAVFLDGSNK
jgi:DNA-binding XRE family transcriptional regulator